MIQDRYTTFELLASLLKTAESTKALKSMKNKICTGWCNKGHYCNEDRCSIAKTFEELRPVMAALDESNEALRASAALNKKDRWQTTKHRGENKIMLGAIARSITCTKKRIVAEKTVDIKKVEALDNMMIYLNKGNKQYVKVLATKYGFDKILEVIKNNTKVYNKREG